jgi:hypothetical protein
MTALVLAATAVMFTGCAATQTAISKRDLDVQTKSSATIFLDPVSQAEQTVFVQIRNTSDKQDLDIAADVIAAVQSKGYRVVQDPKQAKFYLQANVLHVGKTDPTAIQQQLGGGFGAGLSGAAVGLAAMSLTGGYGGPSGKAMIGAGLLGGITEVVAGSLVKDVYFSIVTDVQIKERLPEGKKAMLNSQHINKQGTTGNESVNYSDAVDMKTYQTRIVSSANKMNLEFAEAAPALRAGLTRAIAGAF